MASEAITVRHGAPLAGDAIVTLRYFRIRKGTFDEFVAVSRDGVWPFFEKIGARVVGMWQVVHPADVDDTGDASAAYDEVWLMTRYASVAHWRATRDMARLGGNGDDYRAAMAALARRRELTLESDVRFLQGRRGTTLRSICQPWSDSRRSAGYGDAVIHEACHLGAGYVSGLEAGDAKSGILDQAADRSRQVTSAANLLP